MAPWLWESEPGQDARLGTRRHGGTCALWAEESQRGGQQLPRPAWLPTLLGLKLSCGSAELPRLQPGAEPWLLGEGYLSSPQLLCEEGFSFLFHRGRDSGSEGCPIHLGVWWAFEPTSVPCPGWVWDLQSEGQPSAGSPQRGQGRTPPRVPGAAHRDGTAPFRRWCGRGQTPFRSPVKQKGPFHFCCFLPCPLPVGLPAVTPGPGAWRARAEALCLDCPSL